MMMMIIDVLFDRAGHRARSLWPFKSEVACAPLFASAMVTPLPPHYREICTVLPVGGVRAQLWAQFVQ